MEWLKGTERFVSNFQAPLVFWQTDAQAHTIHVWTLEVHFLVYLKNQMHW